jgi:hypothetical protein
LGVPIKILLKFSGRSLDLAKILAIFFIGIFQIPLARGKEDQNWIVVKDKERIKSLPNLLTSQRSNGMS